MSFKLPSRPLFLRHVLYDSRFGSTPISEREEKEHTVCIMSLHGGVWMRRLVIHQSSWSWDRKEARVCRRRRVMMCSDATVRLSLSQSLSLSLCCHLMYSPLLLPLVIVRKEANPHQYLSRSLQNLYSSWVLNVLEINVINRKNLVSLLQPGSVGIWVWDHLGYKDSQLWRLAPADVEAQLCSWRFLQYDCTRQELGELIVVVGVMNTLLWGNPCWWVLIRGQEDHWQLVVIIRNFLIHCLWKHLPVW